GGINARRALFPTSVNLTIDANDLTTAQNFVAACRSLPGGTMPVTDDAFGSEGLLNQSYTTANITYSHVMPPNGVSCIGNPAFPVSDGSWGGVGAAVTATSNHPGGINVALCDGSVRFIKNSIGIPTWWALGTRGMGEVVSADQ